MNLRTFMQEANIQSAFVPVDMQAGANNGDWVSLKDYKRVICVLFKAAGTAGDDPVFKLQQATANDGTGAKDLDFTEIYKKVGDQTTLGQFTKATQAVATSHTDAASAEAQAVMAVEIKDTDLDFANGFAYVQLSVADVGTNAQLGCGFYILLDPRYAEETPASAIA